MPPLPRSGGPWEAYLHRVAPVSGRPHQYAAARVLSGRPPRSGTQDARPHVQEAVVVAALFMVDARYVASFLCVEVSPIKRPPGFVEPTNRNKVGRVGDLMQS